jgi:hypothetical protein
MSLQPIIDDDIIPEFLNHPNDNVCILYFYWIIISTLCVVQSESGDDESVYYQNQFLRCEICTTCGPYFESQ